MQLAAAVDFPQARLTSLECHFMYAVKTFSTILATFLLMASLGCASSRTQEGTGEYLDDSVITAKVKAAILGEPGLKVAEINVETFKGVVQLSGFVNSREDINKAMRVARAVDGVTSVENDMQLK
jgi:osmotically-inducible protein OsmY